MDGSFLWQILLQFVLILLNAVFACAEIAFISINDKKLERMAAGGHKKAEKLFRLTKQPAKFLSVIQVGITFAGFLGSAFAAGNFSEKLTMLFISLGVKVPVGTLNTVSVILITMVLSYFTLVFGELVPKRVAMRHAEKIGFAMADFISFISKIFAPIVWLLTLSTNSLLRLIGIDPNVSDEEVTEEEIRLMVDVGGEKGAIDSAEREFINNLFDFDDRAATEVMTHRTEVLLLWLEDGIDEWERLITESTYTVYPVCSESVDNIIGVLNAKEYFRLKAKDKEEVLKTCVKPAYFVPETIRIDVLLRDMKQNRNYFSVVMDEYGGMSGIVTIHDLLEQLVGNLDDSTLPVERPKIESLESGIWRIDGSAQMDEVSKTLGVVLPDNGYDTFGGLVFDLLGQVPGDGATPEVVGCGLRIKVLKIKDRRLVEASVCLSK